MSFPRYPAYKPSGIEWMGDVPEHWGVAKFRHCFQESSEKIEEEVIGEMLSVSGYRGIEIKEYDDENRRRTDDELVGYRVVRPGQLVVNTMWLNYAGLGVSSIEGHVSPAYRSYWVDESLNKGFVHHLMRSSLYVKGYTKYLTGIRPNSLQMSRESLMTFPVLIPSKQEQSLIADFLDSETRNIDALVAEQQKLIALLKEKRQAVISQAVTKGLDPAAPMKDSGIEWLGEIPEHWTVTRFKWIADLIDGDRSSAYPSDEDIVDEGIPFLSSKNIVGYKFTNRGLRFITQEKFNSLSRGKILDNDLAITVRGTIGHVAIFDAQLLGYPSAFINAQMMIVRPKLVDSSFVHSITESHYWQKQLDVAAYGTAQQQLSNSILQNVFVVVPPDQEQGEINSFLASTTTKLDELSAEAERGVELLKERRSTLISAAVTGKIDVRGLSAIREAAA